MLYTIWLTSRLSRNYYFLYQHYYSKSNKDKLCNTDYGHPFLIKTTQITGTANTYSTGVTNNGASNGTLTFVVPTNAPNTLYYICEFHSPMTGTITIKD